MAFNQYYGEELAYLRGLGAEFARTYPALSRYLGEQSDDPDVERLLEGFAFLAGRIRQKLDDGFPEIIQTLMCVLWPHFLRSVPACSIMQFDPLPGRLPEVRELPSGTGVRAMTADGPITFRTTAEFDIAPLTVENIILERDGGSAGTLRIVLRASENVDVSKLPVNKLRFYVSGENAFDFYRWLCTSLVECRLSTSGGSGMRIPNPRPAGFDTGHTLHPYPASSFQGYRLLHEYFVFPEKFMFIEFSELAPAIQSSGVSGRFELSCRSRETPPAVWRLSKESLRLYCTPAVNLFTAEAEPIRVTRQQVEYEIRPPKDDCEVYSVSGANAWVEGSYQDRPYRAFLIPAEDPETTFFKAHSRTADFGQSSRTFASFVHPRSAALIPSAEIVTFAIECSNGERANSLRPGEISEPTDTSPDFATFRNVSRVSPYLPAHATEEFPWILLSHMVISPQTLNSASTLRSHLSLYNLSERADARTSRANARRIDSIRNLSLSTEDFVLTRNLDPEGRWHGRYGVPLRGATVNLDLDGSHFASRGDLYLFTSILNQFFSLYATVNSMTRLIAKDITSGEEVVWPPRRGEQFAN